MEAGQGDPRGSQECVAQQPSPPPPESVSSLAVGRLSLPPGSGSGAKRAERSRTSLVCRAHVHAGVSASRPSEDSRRDDAGIMMAPIRGRAAVGPECCWELRICDSAFEMTLPGGAALAPSQSPTVCSLPTLRSGELCLCPRFMPPPALSPRPRPPHAVPAPRAGLMGSSHPEGSDC